MKQQRERGGLLFNQSRELRPLEEFRPLRRRRLINLSPLQPHQKQTGNGSPSPVAPRLSPSSPGLNTVREEWNREMERERERAAFASHQNQMFSREAAKTHSENDDDEKKNLSQLPTTGLVGILPKLWEKDLHRIITGWANEFGPVFKLRVMQFHVSREFFQFSVFFFFFPRKAASRLTPPSLNLSQPLLSFSLSLSKKKKKTGHRHHRPRPGNARLPLQAARQVPLPVPLHGRGKKKRERSFCFPFFSPEKKLSKREKKQRQKYTQPLSTPTPLLLRNNKKKLVPGRPQRPHGTDQRPLEGRPERSSPRLFRRMHEGSLWPRRRPLRRRL